MIKAVIFDLWEVLATKKKLVSDTIFEEYNLTEAARPYFLAQLSEMELGEISESQFWNNFYSEFKIDPDIPVIQWLNIYKDITIINKELLTWAKELRASGHTVGIISNTDPAAAEYLKVQRILDNFDESIFSFDVNCLKPDMDIYLHALKKFDVMPNETLFIDDRPKNIETAINLGMNGLIYTDVDAAKNYLVKLQQR